MSAPLSAFGAKRTRRERSVRSTLSLLTPSGHRPARGAAASCHTRRMSGARRRRGTIFAANTFVSLRNCQLTVSSFIIAASNAALSAG
jgi:hypothetical protein